MESLKIFRLSNTWGDIDDFLARFMVYVNDNAPEKLIVDYENLFIRCMQISYDLLGENGFRFSGNGIRRPINMPLFEALSYLFSFVPEKIDYTWGVKTHTGYRICKGRV